MQFAYHRWEELLIVCICFLLALDTTAITNGQSTITEWRYVHRYCFSYVYNNNNQPRDTFTPADRSFIHSSEKAVLVAKCTELL